MAPTTHHTAKLTYREYLQFPDDGKRHEIIDGVHYVSPSPSTAHQDASRHIQFQLYRQIEEPGLGRIYDAPMDLQLSEVDVVQPDLLLVLWEHRGRIAPKKLIGPPDLVVEILSPSTSERDRHLKRTLYEQRLVPEYWLVDLDEQSVSRYRADADTQYHLVETCYDQISYSAAPAGDRTQPIEANVDLDRVWRR
jgi:Uma2 family endonuclease